MGAWLVKRKSSSLRCGIFFCQALRKKAIQGPEAYKIGKTYPDGIIHSQKFKDMKLQLIENICKRVVSLVLLTGICLLYSKGIIPVYLIVLFLLSGTIIGFFFRAFLLVIKVILILSVMGMLV